MIIRINGKLLTEERDLMQPKSIRNKSGINKLMEMALPMGTKAVFALAAATMVMDAFFGGGMVAMAASKTISISGAFEPVKAFLLDLADPLCYIMFVWGCVECIVGRPASGLNRMKYAAIGYIAINWIPMVMQMIRSTGPGV